MAYFSYDKPLINSYLIHVTSCTLHLSYTCIFNKLHKNVNISGAPLSALLEKNMEVSLLGCDVTILFIIHSRGVAWC